MASVAQSGEAENNANATDDAVLDAEGVAEYDMDTENPDDMNMDKL